MRRVDQRQTLLLFQGVTLPGVLIASPIIHGAHIRGCCLRSQRTRQLGLLGCGLSSAKSDHLFAKSRWNWSDEAARPQSVTRRVESVVSIILPKLERRLRRPKDDHSGTEFEPGVSSIPFAGDVFPSAAFTGTGGDLFSATC